MTTTMIYDDLTERQQAYRAVCERFWIKIGDAHTSSGEDSALYFSAIVDGEMIEPEQEVKRYCAVTIGQGSSGDDIYYAYADFDTLEGAQAKAARNIADDIFSELPMQIIDLDTDESYTPIISVEWRRR